MVLLNVKRNTGVPIVGTGVSGIGTGVPIVGTGVSRIATGVPINGTVYAQKSIH